MDELLTGYELASIKGESTMPYATKISQLFRGSPQKQQEALLTNIYNRVVGDTITEKNSVAGKFGLIDLYAMLAEIDDKRLDDLSFRKGEICALQTGDTVMLKECITALNLSDHSKTAQVVEYISTLQDYLEEIRNFIPVSLRLDGVWVSDLISNMKTYNNWGKKVLYPTPALVLNIQQGDVTLEKIGTAISFAECSAMLGLQSKIKNDEMMHAQRIFDISRNKVYFAWSNEKLKIPNQSIALKLGQTASDITTDAIREGTSSLIGDIGGNLLGGVVGNIIGESIADLFAPSKIIYLLEMELEKVNDYELKGRFCFKSIKIDANGTPNISKDEGNIYFMKYSIESEVYFGSSGKDFKYIPGIGVIKDFPKQNIQEFRELATKYQKGFNARKSWSFEEYHAYFSRLQIKKLIYYNEQQLLQHGCTNEVLCFGNRKTAIIGIYFNNRTDEEVKLPDNMKGVYVYDVLNKDDNWYTPAYLFGINRGDIILSIDGFEMDTPEKCIQYIQSLNPYDWVKVRIKRGNKEMDIDVELTWK